MRKSPVDWGREWYDLRMDFLVAKLKDRFEVDDQPEPATNQLEPATVADDDDLPF